MTTSFSPLSETAPEDFRRAIEVTFLGQVWGTMAALKRMRLRDRGNIVNVGSALAFIGIPLQAGYCSAKFPCRGFFESTRAELIHDGSNVRLSMVHLPVANTPQFNWCRTALDRHPQPVPPIYEPEVAAKYVVEVALDGRRSRIVGSWNKSPTTTAHRLVRAATTCPPRGQLGPDHPRPELVPDAAPVQAAPIWFDQDLPAVRDRTGLLLVLQPQPEILSGVGT